MIISINTAAIVLFAVSVAFNQIVDITGKKSGSGGHPLTSVFVALGVVYTLIVAYMVDGFGETCLGVGWLSWQTVLICFAASGTPMIWGDVMRWLNRTER